MFGSNESRGDREGGVLAVLDKITIYSEQLFVRPWIRLCNSNNVFSTWVNQRVALSVVLCEVGLVKHIGNGLTSEQNQRQNTPIS